MGVSLAVLLVAAAVLYVGVFQARPTAITYSASATSVSPDDAVRVNGRISPAQAGRVVTVSMRGRHGAWRDVARVTTDPAGSFTTQFAPASPGAFTIRANVATQGRYLSDIAEARALRVLEPTTLTLEGAEFARTTKAARFSGQVTPDAQREVTLQQSADKQSWSNVGSPLTTSADGTFRFKAKNLKAGQLFFRTVSAATATAARGESSLVSVTVEDYKAAGAYYLKVTNRWNDGVHDWDAVVDQYNAGAVGLDSLKQQSGTVSAIAVRAAKDLRRYPSWPHELRPMIDRIEQDYVLEADTLHQMAGAADVQSFLTSLNGFGANKGSEHSALIRDALGLPQRPTD